MPTPKYWMMKTEPGEYSYQDLEQDGWTHWDGVRNYQAQNNMKAMAVGDLVLIYHSVGPKEVVGVAQVSRAAYPDPEEPEGSRWILVDIKPVKALSQPVHLKTIKEHNTLCDIPLVKQSRLSVMPLEKVDFNGLLKLGGVTQKAVQDALKAVSV